MNDDLRDHDVPWERNACLTIKADSRVEVDAIFDSLNAYARKIGAGSIFSDYEGPQDPAEAGRS